MSLCTTCKDLGIDPQAYLRDVLDRISTHPARRIEELLPDRWQELHQARGRDRAVPPLARDRRGIVPAVRMSSDRRQRGPVRRRRRRWSAEISSQVAIKGL